MILTSQVVSEVKKMKNDDALNKNIEKLISLHGREQKMDEQQKKKIVEKLITIDTRDTVVEVSNFNNFHKIAIAALVILVPAVIAMYLLVFSQKKIEIPPELVSMSLDELVKLNYDSSQNSFDPEIVKYALQQALEKAAPEEVIKIAKSLDSGRPKGQSALIAPPEHPLPHLGYIRKAFREVVEESDLFVHARVISCNLNVDDIISALVEKEKFSSFEDFTTRYKVSIQLEIIECLPEGTYKAGKILTIPTVLYEDQLNKLQNNSEYFFAMVKQGDREPVFLDYFSGVYTLDTNSSNIPEMWKFFADAQKILLMKQHPEPEVIDYWGSRLESNAHELAEEYLDMLRNESVVKAANENTNESTYKNDMALQEDEYLDIRSSLEGFLIDPNRDSTNKQYSLMNRFQAEQNAFKSLENLPDFARPSHEEMVHYLVLIYERNKENESCRNFAVNTMRDFLEPTDVECVPLLTQMLLMDKPPSAIPKIIINRIPDPSLVPAIRAAISLNNFNRSSAGELFEALYTCGQKDEAITKSLEILSGPVREDTSMNMLDDLGRDAALILFLGKTQRQEVLPVINEYTGLEYIKKYKGFYNDIAGIVIDFTLDELRQNAIIALARLGGKTSIPRLREIYNTTDDIRAKLVSAVGLYYNGDKTGEILLRHIVEGTHRSVPDIAIRWGHDISDGTVFQDIIKSYLRNELTDALWLEKLTYYIDRADAEIISDTNIESGFFKEHRREILDIMVEQLDNRNLATRQFAQEILQKATGQYFGFDSGRYAGQQEEIVQKWREYINTNEE